MPLAPHQILLATVELLVLLVGTWVLVRAIALPELRAAIFGQNRLTHWDITGFEAALLALAIVICGALGQGGAVQFLGPLLAGLPDRAGLEVVIYGLGFHGVALLAWPAFRVGRRYAHSDYGRLPPASPAARPLGPRSLIWKSLTTLLLALPVLGLASLGWNALLRRAGLPDAPQDLIAIFGAVQSRAVLIAMLFVACVLAPINEELLFRGVIFRFCRQRFGRAIALGVSGVLFGAMHANWAGFVPLALLGVALALAYEHSGDIRVPIVAHGLFNLNTTLIILSGLPNA
jgi:membrane protease YdiL (CAAX protease family)